jgi:TatA/E family protein of Tat protein translocase
VFEGAFSPVHILIVGIVALLVLGPDKLPDAARTAGKAWRELQQMRGALGDHVRDIIDEAGPGEFRPGAQPAPEPTREVLAVPTHEEAARDISDASASGVNEDPPGSVMRPASRD